MTAAGNICLENKVTKEEARKTFGGGIKFFPKFMKQQNITKIIFLSRLFSFCEIFLSYVAQNSFGCNFELILYKQIKYSYLFIYFF